MEYLNKKMINRSEVLKCGGKIIFLVFDMKFFSYRFSILILFSRKIMSAKLGEIWWKPGRYLMCLDREMTADSNSRRDFLQCTSLTDIAWKKLKECLRSHMWEKRVFRSSYSGIPKSLQNSSTSPSHSTISRS